jgi:hypothetical protein
MKTMPVLLILLTLAMPYTASARIQLVALPDREETVVRLDNRQATLVEEERVLALQQGVNRVDFSWRGVHIDPDSIRLEILSHPGQVTLLNVSYPPKEDALVWEIASQAAVEERVRIVYLLSNIDRLFEHKARIAEDGGRLELQTNMIIRNFSGEGFTAARFTLNGGMDFRRDMEHQETKRLMVYRLSQVPFEKTYTWDAGKQPHDPKQAAGNVGLPVHYVIENDVQHGLGRHPVWAGKVRIEQEDGKGGTVFLGEDRIAFTPVGEKAELYIGDSRDISVTQRKLQERRLNVRRDRKGKIVLYDLEVVIRATVKSFMEKPVTVTILEPMPKEWEIAECNVPYEVKDAEGLRFFVPVEPQSEAVLDLHYFRRNIR